MNTLIQCIEETFSIFKESFLITKQTLQYLSAILMLSEIHKCQSKRQAADAMNTTVDTINKYISNLEKSLGLALTVNTSKGCSLTPQAISIIEKMDDMQASLLETCQQHQNKYQGEVTVGIPLAVSSHFAAQNSADFYKSYPDISINTLISVDDSSIFTGAADIDIVIGEPPSNNDTAVIFSRNISYGLFASSAFSRQHGLPKDLKDLNDNFPVIYKNTNTKYLPPNIISLKKSKHLRMSSNSTIHIAEAVNNGIGIGILPCCMKRRGLVLIRNIKPKIKLPIYMLANRKTKDIPKIRAVIEHFKGIMSQM